MDGAWQVALPYNLQISTFGNPEKVHRWLQLNLGV